MNSPADVEGMAERQRLTYPRVKAASKLYAEHLPNWCLAVSAFERLTTEDFSDKAICLLAVVAVDALFSTGLRYRPGISESIADSVSNCIGRWKKENPPPHHVEEIAKKFRKRGSDGAGPISFFSKFFHFFVSDNYPIFDDLAYRVLQEKHGFSDIKKYSSFCAAVTALREQIEEQVSIREVDRYLWLTGKYIQWRDAKVDGASRGNEALDNTADRSEVFKLLDTATEEQGRLLNDLTSNDYQQFAPRALLYAGKKIGAG